MYILELLWASEENINAATTKTETKGSSSH
jgi:hypothetical protein